MRNDEKQPVEKPDHHPNGRFHEHFYQSVPNILLNDVRDKTLHPTDVVVYMGFADHVRGKDNCWVSNRTVAKLLGFSPKTIERSVKHLAKAGRVERSNGKSTYGTKTTRLLVRVGDEGIIRQGSTQTNSTGMEAVALSRQATTALDESESWRPIIGKQDSVDNNPPTERGSKQPLQTEDERSAEYFNEHPDIPF